MVIWPICLNGLRSLPAWLQLGFPYSLHRRAFVYIPPRELSHGSQLPAKKGNSTCLRVPRMSALHHQRHSSTSSEMPHVTTNGDAIPLPCISRQVQSSVCQDTLIVASRRFNHYDTSTVLKSTLKTGPRWSSKIRTHSFSEVWLHIFNVTFLHPYYTSRPFSRMQLASLWWNFLGQSSIFKTSLSLNNGGLIHYTSGSQSCS